MWGKPLQTEETRSAKALRYELGEFEVQEGGAYGQGESSRPELAFMEKKNHKKKKCTSLEHKE